MHNRLFSLILLFLCCSLNETVQAQSTIVLAGGGSEGDIGDTSAWSYRLYKAFVENGDRDGDGVVRVAILTTDPNATGFLPDYFEWIGTTLGVTVEGTNYEIRTKADANNVAKVGAVANADAVFLKGGDQGVYYDEWNDTLLETNLRVVADQGGAIGGTSAGAMSQAGYCFCGGRDLISSDVMANATTSYLDDAGTPGQSGIKTDFLGFVPNTVIDTHFTERGRLGRLLGILARATADSGEDTLLGIGIETSTGLVLQQNVVEVVGEGSVSFLQQKPNTERFRSANRPLVYTHLRLDVLTEGWRFDLATRLPDLVNPPAGVVPVVYPGDGLANSKSLTIDGGLASHNSRFQRVATYYPNPYTLTQTTARTFVREAIGFTHTDRDDDRKGDRQEILFRALYDQPQSTGFLLFGALSGVSSSSGKLTRPTSNPDQLAASGGMASILIDGKTITHKGLSPIVNFYTVNSAALVNATVHVLAESTSRQRWYNSRTHTLVGGTAHPIAGKTEDLPAAFTLSPAWPNPFNPQARFSLTLAQSQWVRIAVIDLLGRTVSTLHDGPLAAQVHTFTFEASGLPSGLYLVRATGETTTALQPLVLAK